MKEVFLSVVLCITSLSFYGQTVTESSNQTGSDTTIYTTVKVEASYPGGDAGWRSFIANNINHMVLVDRQAPDGVYTAFIVFIVRADGTITDIMCENSPGFGVCEEGVRVIKKSKKWIPAQVNGKSVNSYKRQPISLSIQGG